MALAIFGLLAISFVVIFSFQKRSLKLKNKYPQIDCGVYEQEYAGREKSWSHDAVNEFKVNQANEENGANVHFTGVLQCFCVHEHQGGKPVNQLYAQTNSAGDV